MKSKIKVIVSFAIIVGLIAGGVGISKRKQKPECLPTLPEPETLSWHANYIWGQEKENNTWMCFRKKVQIDELADKILAQIAVDSKYWLYINGEIVIREGGVKRGQTPHSIYYDEVELTSYFQKGENTIAILVWYWGDEGASYNPSGQGALLFQAKNGKDYIISDETWKVSKNTAFGQDKLRPNNRLVEYNILYDANLAQENWMQTTYDDTTWENAQNLGTAGSQPWGEMIARDIPQFKNSDLQPYENSHQYAGYTTTQKETLEMTLPTNYQLTPYLKIDSPKGLEITIKTDTYEDVNGDSVRCRYQTKNGEQEFESPAWMNGEKVYYTIPKGVKIIHLGYRETGYDTEITGNFTCDNEFLNHLWEKASRTLYVNMRDSYMDCPNRERAQWWGDVNLEMMEAMYALDTSAFALYEKGVKTMLGWKKDDILPTIAPNTLEMAHLPVQMLAGIHSFYEYYEYTGKKEFIQFVYPHAKNYLALWKSKENGLMECSVTYPIWKWGDSVAECDYEAIENAWYGLALTDLQKMAKILEYEEDSNQFLQHFEQLKSNFQNLWTQNGYKTPEAKNVDERANSVAVLAGLAKKEQYPVIQKILTTQYEATPCMEKYVLEALCEMGYIEEAQKRMEERYQEMINGKEACSTLWENWKKESGTQNHAWSGGPLIILSQYFAGIEPLKKGYDELSIKPQMGNLKEISCGTTTIKGQVSVEVKKTEDQILMKIKVPVKTRVGVPKLSGENQISVNGKTIYKNNKQKEHTDVKYHSEDEKYVYFYVESGEYQWESKTEDS